MTTASAAVSSTGPTRAWCSRSMATESMSNPRLTAVATPALEPTAAATLAPTAAAAAWPSAAPAPCDGARPVTVEVPAADPTAAGLEEVD